MSRSYVKKYRISSIVDGTKKHANKKVRQDKDFHINGTKYKRLYCSWKIGSHPIIIPEGEDWSEETRRK